MCKTPSVGRKNEPQARQLGLGCKVYVGVGKFYVGVGKFYVGVGKFYVGVISLVVGVISLVARLRRC